MTVVNLRQKAGLQEYLRKFILNKMSVPQLFDRLKEGVDKRGRQDGVPDGETQKPKE